MSKKLLASAGLTGILLLTAGSQPLQALPEKAPEQRLPLGLITKEEIAKLLKKLLTKSLPAATRVLTETEEQALSDLIQSTLGIKAVVELDGNRLNHQIGLMGLEQYLKRFPGDNLSGRNFPQAGLAPGKGAWGYFAPSKNLLTANLAQKEKYYVAVQTLYLPDWQTRLGELYRWYQYRKVLVLNPDNGSAVVAVIADAGPAKYTGKQFGGSPQVMFDLGFYPRHAKGKVIVLFVDDPQDKIPLGPITQPLNIPQPKLI